MVGTTKEKGQKVFIAEGIKQKKAVTERMDEINTKIKSLEANPTSDNGEIWNLYKAKAVMEETKDKGVLVRARVDEIHHLWKQ